jgi:hypothetical protein
VHLQNGVHGVEEAVQGLAVVGVPGVAAAVAGIDFALGVEKEHDEGEVVVELKQIQVEIVDARQPNADELVGGVFDSLETDNLPVEIIAVNSRHAAQDRHERLARLFRLGLALGEAGDPPMPGGVLIPAP